MGEVAKNGRTVLFVSHNMAAVQQLCASGLVMQNGRIHFGGPIAKCITAYNECVAEVRNTDLGSRTDRIGNKALVFTAVKLHNDAGDEIRVASTGQTVRIRFHYTAAAFKKSDNIMISFNIKNSAELLISNLNTVDTGKPSLEIHKTGYFECHWPRLNLRSGKYDCALFCSVNGEIADWLQNAFIIDIEDGDFYNTGKLVDRTGGDVLIDHSWSSAN